MHVIVTQFSIRSQLGRTKNRYDGNNDMRHRLQLAGQLVTTHAIVNVSQVSTVAVMYSLKPCNSDRVILPESQ